MGSLPPFVGNAIFITSTEQLFHVGVLQDLLFCFYDVLKITTRARHFLMFLSHLSFDELLVHVVFQHSHWCVIFLICFFVKASKILRILISTFTYVIVLSMLLWFLTL